MRNEELPLFLAELKELTEIESPTEHVEGVREVSQWFARKAQTLGLSHKFIPMQSKSVADCLLVTNNLEAKTYDLLLVAHMDTVFPVGSTKDVSFVQKGNLINALGIIDDKAGALMSFYIIKELDLSKLNVALYLNSHEETGSNFSKESIEEYAKKSRYCLVMEPAREDGSMVATRKGFLSYKIDFHGVASHAGNSPEKGRSAVVEASRVIVELSKLTDFSAGHTFNSIMTEGGVARNIVPDFASITMEMRYRVPSSLEFFEQKLEEILSKPLVSGVTYTKTLLGGEAPMIDEVNLPKIKEIFAEVGKAHGTKVTWVDAGGVSDGNIASSVGCPTIDGLGPTGGNMHAKTEYLEVDSIVPKCNLVLDVIKKLL